MNIIWIMIPMALGLSFFFLYACFWALNSKQFDDLDTPQIRILKDDLIERKLNEPTKQ